MDTKAQHTPGPWRLEGRCVITDGHVHSDRNSEIATVSGPREFGTTHNENELFYNAALIAAAPDLLAALRALTEAANNREAEHSFGRKTAQGLSALSGALGAARAAIAKVQS